MIIKKGINHIKFPLLAVLFALVLFSVAQAATIDPTNKWAWSTNAGWVNFNDANGSVDVYADHLEGYAWAENVGWIRMGTTTGGTPHTYANDAANTYGVNNDGCGNLSGSAWGTNVGWIDFDDLNGNVTIDPVSGEFDGYAWSENVGWVHLKDDDGGGPNAYNVAASSMGNLTYHQTDTAAIIASRSPGPSSSSGLIIGNSTFLNDSSDCIVFGHNNVAFQGGVTTNLSSSGADKRWARIWELDVHDGSGTAGGNVTLTFDISDAGGNAGVADFSPSGTYFLLKRAAGSNDDFTDVSVIGWVASGDQLTFMVDASNLGSEFTVGGTASSPTAVKLQSIHVNDTSATRLLMVVALLLLATLGGIALRRQFE
ncbi:MAG: hypothetical protein GY796_25810 [Chloroflexi bacterium]|nr:hypothetical protein [Chloroflexota bacterium]